MTNPFFIILAWERPGHETPDDTAASDNTGCKLSGKISKKFIFSSVQENSTVALSGERSLGDLCSSWPACGMQGS